MLDELDFQDENNGNDSDNESDDEEFKDEVPISLALIIITLYFIAICYYFQQSENWGTAQSIYFSIVTSTSIVNFFFEHDLRSIF